MAFLFIHIPAIVLMVIFQMNLDYWFLCSILLSVVLELNRWDKWHRFLIGFNVFFSPTNIFKALKQIHDFSQWHGHILSAQPHLFFVHSQPPDGRYITSFKPVL